MTTYNTNNPVPSVDVRDLYDNAENLDNFSNGAALAYTDRKGVSRQSLAGIRAASSYQHLGAYGAGLVFTSYNQTFSYLGEFYAPSAGAVLPYTTTGVGAAEIATFRSVGDATLRDDLANAVSTAKGAALVGYRANGVGAVGTSQKQLNDEHISIFRFMTPAEIADVQSGNPVLDHTAAITKAHTAVTAAGKALFWPAGTYLTGAIEAITNMKWVGENSSTTRIKLKDGSNSPIIAYSRGDEGADFIWISGITFDGNSANNTVVDHSALLTITGIRPTLVDLFVIKAPGRGIQTSWILQGIGYGNLTGAQGYFERITIAESQEEGWVHLAPTDSFFNCIDFLNCCLKANNTYAAFDIQSNGRFSNIHPSNGAEYSVVPTVGVRVVSNGNNFSNCHFEGGYTPLHVVGDCNVLENCTYYAPRGLYCIDLSGTGNRLTGTTGATYFGGNPDYKGLQLRGANNHVELTDTGCFFGAVDFTGDQGGNIVRISGYHSYGVPYVGTPHVSDDVLISVGGPGGGKFVQQLPAPISTYTPVVTPAGGKITSYAATGNYRKVGKLTELYLDITITDNGTGSGALLVSLPALPVVQGFLAGQEQAISGVSLCARLQPASANLSLTNYANANPGGTGARFLISGSYITAA